MAWTKADVRSAEQSDFMPSKIQFHILIFIPNLRATGSANGYKIVFDPITDFRIQMKELNFLLGNTSSAFDDP